MIRAKKITRQKILNAPVKEILKLIRQENLVIELVNVEPEEALYLLACKLAKVNPQGLNADELPPEDYNKVQEALEIIEHSPLCLVA